MVQYERFKNLKNFHFLPKFYGKIVKIPILVKKKKEEISVNQKCKSILDQKLGNIDSNQKNLKRHPFSS